MIRPCAIPDVLLIQPKRFEDERGYFSEVYNADMARDAGLPHFVQDNESLSRSPGVMRGLHFQLPPFAQAKLVRCTRGSFFDVAVDIRKGSPTFGRHVSVELSARTGLQVFIPKGFAHGFWTLEEDTQVNYKVDQPYAADHERGIAWDDPQLDIDWPTGVAALVSGKDASNPTFADLLPELEGVDWT